jgi:hypothetical protein
MSNVYFATSTRTAEELDAPTTALHGHRFDDARHGAILDKLVQRDVGGVKTFTFNDFREIAQQCSISGANVTGLLHGPRGFKRVVPQIITQVGEDLYTLTNIGREEAPKGEDEAYKLGAAFTGKFATKPTSEAVETALQPLIDNQRVKVIAPITYVKEVTKKGKTGKEMVIYQHHLTSTSAPQDMAFIAQLQQDRKKFSNEEWSQIIRGSRYFCTNASFDAEKLTTMTGLIARLKKNMGGKAPNFVIEPDLFQKVCDSLAVDDFELSMMGIKGHKVNVHASAGLHFITPQGLIPAKESCSSTSPKPLMAETMRFLAALGKAAKTSAFMTAFKSELPVLLKNKYGPNTVSGASEKIRPYYVYPGHASLALGYAVDGFSHARGNFLTKPGCVSAMRFSWAHGGPRKLVNFILEQLAVDKPGFVIFGDNKFRYFNDRTGTPTLELVEEFPDLDPTPKPLRRVMASDASGCDASIKGTLSTINKAYIAKVIQKALTGAEAGLWRKVFELWGVYSSNADVCVYGPLVLAYRDAGLLSGVVGVTYLDEVPLVYIEHACDDLFEGELEPKILMEIYQDIHKEHGVTVKPDSMLMGTIDENGFRGADFLGCEVHSIPDSHGNMCMVPVPSLEAVVRSICAAKKKYQGADGVARRMGAYIGLAMSGGFAYKPLYDALARQFNILVKANPEVSPLGVLDQEEIDEMWGHGYYLDRFAKARTFPTRDWILHLYNDEKAPSMEEEEYLPPSEVEFVDFLDDEAEELVMERLMNSVSLRERPAFNSGAPVAQPLAAGVDKNLVPESQAGRRKRLIWEARMRSNAEAAEVAKARSFDAVAGSSSHDKRTYRDERQEEDYYPEEEEIEEQFEEEVAASADYRGKMKEMKAQENLVKRGYNANDI